jgi:hypothetical protein
MLAQRPDSPRALTRIDLRSVLSDNTLALKVNLGKAAGSGFLSRQSSEPREAPKEGGEEASA